MFTKKIRKKCTQILFCTGLLLSMGIGFAGCKDKKEENNNTVIESNEYYEKMPIEFPENGIPKHLSNTSQGGLYVVAGEEVSADTVWYFDGVDKWEKKYDLHEVLGIDKDSYCDAYVSSKGEIFAIYNDELKVTDEAQIYSNDMKYCFVDEAGNKKAVSLDLPKLDSQAETDLLDSYGAESKYVNYVDVVKFYDEKIYIKDLNDNIYEIAGDNHKCIYEYDGINNINEFIVCDQMLIVNDFGTVNYVSLNSDEIDKSKKDTYTEFFNNAVSNSLSSVNMDIQNEKLWVLSNDKMSSYNFNSKEMNINKATGYAENENIFDIAIDNGAIYALANNYENSNIKLYRYQVPDDSGENNTDAETGSIKIWVLNTSCSMIAEEAKRTFTDMYPNVNVDIEIALGFDASGQTESDVIKKLNADILAGNGPDIIYMYGLNIDKYIEGDKLYDMSDLVNKLEQEGNYFNNILNSFERDGKVYAVPSSITLVAKAGTNESINMSENYSEFCNYVKEQDKSVLTNEMIYQYIEAMYYKSIYSNLKSGNIEKDKLAEFFEMSKNIWDTIGVEKMPITTNAYFVSNNCMMFDGNSEMVLDYINDASVPYMYMPKIAEALNGSMSIPANDFMYNYFVNDTIAINANSKNLDLAQKFVECALSEKCQGGNYGSQGFAVNKDAMYAVNSQRYASMMATETATDTDATGDFDEFLNTLMQNIEAMNEPIYIDINFNKIFFDELNRYLTGSVGNDEAVDGLLEKIEIYLAE